jgi:hypothetical protein
VRSALAVPRRQRRALLRTAGLRPGRVHNNCSGKHAGMLALALAITTGLWPATTEPEHPVQQRMLREVQRWTELPADAIGVGVDGCGVATFAMPLFGTGGRFARFAGAAAAGGHVAHVVGAMVRHPWVVAGTDRLCTALMQAAEGRLFAKVGAEGVYCVGVPDAGLGMALKVQDGAVRAAEPAVVALLRWLGLLVGRGRGWPLGRAGGEEHAGGARRYGPLRGPSWRRGMDEAVRTLVRGVAALAAGDRRSLDDALRAARRRASPLAVEEALLQSYLFVGYPAGAAGLARRGGHSAANRAAARRGPKTTRSGRRAGSGCAARVRRAVRTAAAQRGALHPDMERG